MNSPWRASCLGANDRYGTACSAVAQPAPWPGAPSSGTDPCPATVTRRKCHPAQLTLRSRSPNRLTVGDLKVAIRMADPEDLASTVRRLEARVQELEALYGLIDLLALPGLLAGGAARIFDSTQSADTIAGQASGFYGREAAGGGLAIRWTRFPEAGELDIAVLGSMPFALELQALHTPHIATAEDIEVRTSDGEVLAFNLVNQRENGVLEFGATLTRPNTGLVRLFISSTRALAGSGGDTRQLGLPFVKLRSRPLLATPAA